MVGLPPPSRAQDSAWTGYGASECVRTVWSVSVCGGGGDSRVGPTVYRAIDRALEAVARHVCGSWGPMHAHTAFITSSGSAQRANNMCGIT